MHHGYMQRPKSLWAPLLIALICRSAAAHHSAAIFDTHTSLLLSGTVREFQFTNPHCFIQLLVPGANGSVEWSVEMGGPTHLLRHGWTPRLLRPGDAITVRVYPLKDGSRGASFVSATRADGRPLGS